MPYVSALTLDDKKLIAKIAVMISLIEFAIIRTIPIYLNKYSFIVAYRIERHFGNVSIPANFVVEVMLIIGMLLLTRFAEKTYMHQCGDDNSLIIILERAYEINCLMLTVIPLLMFTSSFFRIPRNIFLFRRS